MSFIKKGAHFMKKKIIITLLCLFFFGILQFASSPTLNQSITDSTPDGYEATLTITANQLLILNREKLAQSLIQRIVDNDFSRMQFSYDILGYPSGLKVTVYTNALTKYLGLPAFYFRYEQENLYEYNIKDHPEQFELNIIDIDANDFYNKNNF